MSSILLNQKISKRSLTLNKSFVLSIIFHSLLIFAVTFTTFYKLPLIENSPIINVKFDNSSQDSFGNVAKSSAEVPNINKSQDSLINKEINRSVYQAQKIKKLEANSLVSTEEAIYLNLWQRTIESTGDELILSKDIDYPDSRKMKLYSYQLQLFPVSNKNLYQYQNYTHSLHFVCQVRLRL